MLVGRLLLMDLISNIQSRETPVFVLGLGYVGLPLALAAAGAGFKVTGIDTDAHRVEQILGSDPALPDIDHEHLRQLVRSGALRATPSIPELPADSIIVICVPTPLKNSLPDTSYIEGAGREIGLRLKKGSLVILESTTYPGTTEELLLPILESSGLKAGIEFFLGFSPERIDPGNHDFGLANVTKVFGGINEDSGDAIEAFYAAFVDKLARVSTPRAAEMTKLLENTYRHVNIALANEMAILCRDLGIDVWEVIDAAATKPFGFVPFYPGPGWGGHCIPVDPAYLSWRVRQMGSTARFVELAREFNEKMPGYVIDRTKEIVESRGGNLKRSSVLAIGVTYKADVPDLRESPAFEIVKGLVKVGAEVSYHDPFIEQVDLPGGPLRSVELTAETVAASDLVIVLTAHSAIDWGLIRRSAKVVFDTRNVIKQSQGLLVKL